MEETTRPEPPKLCLACRKPILAGQTASLTGNRHSGCRLPAHVVNNLALYAAESGDVPLLALVDEHDELTEQVRRQGAQLAAIGELLTADDETARAIREALSNTPTSKES